MFCEKAFKIVKDLDRSTSNKDIIPPFDENGLREIFEEMNSLFEKNALDVTVSIQGTSDIITSIHLRHAALERNKQCILSYVYKRLLKIRNFRWIHGNLLPPTIRQNISDREKHFFSEYNKILINYSRSVGSGIKLDLISDLPPPKSLMIEIRVIKDYGEFESEQGIPIYLNEGSIHYLPKDDCEALIKEGYVEMT